MLLRAPGGGGICPLAFSRILGTHIPGWRGHGPHSASHQGSSTALKIFLPVRNPRGVPLSQPPPFQGPLRWQNGDLLGRAGLHCHSRGSSRDPSRTLGSVRQGHVQNETSFLPGVAHSFLCSRAADGVGCGEVRPPEKDRSSGRRPEEGREREMQAASHPGAVRHGCKANKTFPSKHTGSRSPKPHSHAGVGHLKRSPDKLPPPPSLYNLLMTRCPSGARRPPVPPSRTMVRLLHDRSLHGESRRPRPDRGRLTQ